MPSPVGHSLTAYVIYLLCPKVIKGRNWHIILLYLFGAIAPDFDFLPGLFIGDLNRYHHGISHSIGFAIFFALTLGIILGALKRAQMGRSFLVLFCLNFSHIILDYFSKDSSVPYGEPFFWPLSNEYYIAPFAFLPAIRRSTSGSGIEFILSLFSLHNLWAVFIECLLLVPIILLVFTLQRRVGVSSR